MKGECIFCGQSMIVNDGQVEDVRENVDFAMDLAARGVSLQDYVATMGCNCPAAFDYKDAMDMLKNGYANVEYICGEKTRLVEAGKMIVRMIVDREIKKASLHYGNTVIKIQKGKGEIKIEKVVTTKEMVEG